MNFPNRYLLIFILSLIEFRWVTRVYSSYFTEIENCKITSMGNEYIGSMNTSETGEDCLPWTKEILDELGLNELHLSDMDVTLANNYCRNPTKHFRPLCITATNPTTWKFCDVPRCKKGRNWCMDSDYGKEYWGQIDYTKSGSVCQSWLKQSSYPAYLFPTNNLTHEKNYCRNPSGYQKGPWCYTVNKVIRWDTCDIPKCDKDLSQVEYFGGYDFIKTIHNEENIINMENVYESVTFSIVINSDSWNSEVQRKTSLWATDYNTDCQTDFDEYEYCQAVNLDENFSQVTIEYKCVKPFRILIVVTPLTKEHYTTEYTLGKLYERNETPSSKFFQYRNKINKFLREKDKDNVKIPFSKYHGSFYLLEDNAIPYAVTTKNEVVMTISQVEKGRIGFIACEHYTDQSYHSKLQNYFRTVYNSSGIINPILLTKKLLHYLDSERRRGKTLTTHVIWSAHYPMGKSNTELLLVLIKNGLKIIIGIKPWAYYYYTEYFRYSELKSLFLAAGIWPSTNSMSDNFVVLDRVVIQTFPLVHLLDYAKSNLENALTVSKTIINTLSNIPFDELVYDNKFQMISENIGSLYPIYLHHVKYIIPCLHKPINNQVDKDLIGLVNTLLLYNFDNLFVAPGTSFYPGKMHPDDINLRMVEMKLNLKFKNEAAQLGLYINPGYYVIVTLLSAKSSICHLHVNYHLFLIYNKDYWMKWPNVYKKITLTRNQKIGFSSSFGGLLSISCEKDDDKALVKLDGVIQVPMYDRRDKESNKNWDNLQQINTPWAVLAGDTAVFVVSSNSIRNMAKPESILELYDYMIKEEYHLKGKSVADNRRELISTDIQIKAGYMHAGYPIGIQILYVTNPGRVSQFIFGKVHIKEEGRWGILHEVGHNLQENLFTFSGTVDVTNNVFTLIGIESLTGLHSWSETEGWVSEEGRIDRFVSYINGGKFTEWQSDPFLALGVYAQIKSYFGWELYAQVFRRYKILMETYGSISDNERIQLWIEETSVKAGMNLCPTYDLWKWPIEETTNKKLSKLPYFMPDDFLTKKVQENVNRIISKYGGPSMVTREALKIPIIIGTLKDKLSIEGSKIIEEMNFFY